VPHSEGTNHGCNGSKRSLHVRGQLCTRQLLIQTGNLTIREHPVYQELTGKHAHIYNIQRLKVPSGDYLQVSLEITWRSRIQVTQIPGGTNDFDHRRHWQHWVELVKRLWERGQSVRVFVRSRVHAQAIALPGVEFHEGDFARPETFAHALAGVNRLFLLIPSSSKVEQQQRDFVEAAKRSQVRHIVKLSQLGADEHAPGASNAITV
jgi:hypothetical protein